MLPEGVDVQALAREIAFRMDPEALLDAKDVSAMLKCEPRYLAAQYAKAPGFPKAARLPTADGKQGHPRWRRREVQAWIDLQFGDAPPTPRTGRTRKKSAYD